MSIHGAPFGGIGKAPKYFFDRWEQSSKQMVPTMAKVDHTEIEFRLAA
jgi:hypothetical protein